MDEAGLEELERRVAAEQAEMHRLRRALEAQRERVAALQRELELLRRLLDEPAPAEVGKGQVDLPF